MKSYFPNDTYETPKDKSRLLLDKLFLNTNLYFAGRVLREIAKARRVALAGKYDDAAWAESSFNIFKIIEEVGGRFHLSGLDNLRQAKGPVVFIGNHMSTLETFILPCVIAPLMRVTFVVKESLVKKGSFFGPVMRARDPIVVGRKKPREDLQHVMTKGQELLANGCSMIIFSHTRKVEFVPEDLNSLGVKLAKKAGVQVIPAALKTDFWGNGRLIKDFGPLKRDEQIHIAFGTPMDVTGGGKEEHRKTFEFIGSHLAKWAKKQ